MSEHLDSRQHVQRQQASDNRPRVAFSITVVVEMQ